MNKTTVIIPMAGHSSRWKESGGEGSKYYADVAGKPLFLRALSCIPAELVHEVILVCLREDERVAAGAFALMRQEGYPGKIKWLQEPPQGPLVTAFTASVGTREGPLLVLHADQVFDWPGGGHFLGFCEGSGAAGVIPYVEREVENWGYLLLAPEDRILAVVEKTRVSNHVTCGCYWFASSLQFQHAASRAIDKRLTSRGEYYVGTAANGLLEAGKEVRGYRIDGVQQVTTLEDLEELRGRYGG